MAELKLLAGEPGANETARAIQACNDWLRLGPGRTLTLLLAKYGKTRRNTAPTASRDTLEGWSADYGWQERAKAHDAAIEDAKNARRREVLEEGLALDYERVVKLKKLAGFLERQIYEKTQAGDYEAVWVPDVKVVGVGEFAETIDVVRYNSPIISDYRRTIDDIAKEVGGRKQRIDLTSGDEPIQVITVQPPAPPASGDNE